MHQYQLTVQPEWLDYNGHMNVAYYVLAFDQATDALYEQWQVGESYTQAGQSLFTLSMNVDYLSEVREGEPLRITTRLLDADHKRIHYFHSMYHGEHDHLVATNECLCMNVDMTTRRSADFPPDVARRFQQLLAQQKNQPQPAGAGRTLSIRRKPSPPTR